MIRVAVVLALIAGPVLADDHTCETEWVNMAAQAERHGVVITELSPQRLAEATKHYNAAEPVTNETFAHGYVGEMPDGYVREVLVDAQGCVGGEGNWSSMQEFIDAIEPGEGI